MAAGTRSPHYRELIGDMYARWTLDTIIEVARAVSLDYIARPDFYRGQVTDKIVDLSFSYGFTRNFPDKHQRSRLNSPIFGVSDGYPLPRGVTAVADKFHQYRGPLFKACIAYTERTVTDSRGGLREAIVQAMTFFPSFLRNFEGYSARLSYEQMHFLSDLCYEILRNPTVSGVFGVAPTPSELWPLKADDQRGSQLIEVISTTLQIKSSASSQEAFTKLRLLAQSGGEALEAVLLDDPTSEGHFEKLVQKVYAWAKSYADYSSMQ
jgi:hypothetical protein